MAVFCGYVLLAAVYTWPLLPERALKIASDPGDPILGATVLQWNATTAPFSSAWWSPPFFYPHEQVAAFTENFVGISALASPIYWLTGDPIKTYNISLFLTWPLSAIGVYLLVRVLTQRSDAAIVAGAAFAFAPYRIDQLPHIVVQSVYWLPIAFWSLHKFLERQQPMWLALFGVAWILLSLSNGYAMMFGGVIVGLWIVYFCSTGDRWRAGAAILIAWALATLPLVPVFLKTKTVHDQFGFHRGLGEILAFSARPWAWTRVSGLSWVWSRVLAPATNEQELFPGLTGVLLICLAGLACWRMRAPLQSSIGPRVLGLRRVVGVLAVLTAIVASITVVTGSWRFDVLGWRVSMGNSTRAFLIAFALAAAYALLFPRVRRALADRPPLTFYVGATLVTMVFACGPVMAYDGKTILDPAPYSWLMALPGFNELRVPTRFWMIGSLCFAVAAGLAFAKVISLRARGRVFITAGVLAAVLLDSWPTTWPMAAIPEAWPVVEPRDRANPILELPAGPEFDFGAMYRTMIHGRRIVNGVSGYEPPAYAILRRGLGARDPGMLLALTSLGSLDVVVDGARDPDGEISKYVANSEGARQLFSDGVRTAYELPKKPWRVSDGKPWPIVAATASAFPLYARFGVDGSVDTQWVTGPQHGFEWFAVDLGETRLVTGIEDVIALDVFGFPRRLVINVSVDGATWHQAWEGPTSVAAFLSALSNPREIAVRVAFDAQPARFVMLRQVGTSPDGWTVSELRVFGPAQASGSR